jgi:hypothetical protein
MAAEIKRALQYHETLRSEIRQLGPHKVFSKWLYISQSHADFKTVAPEIVALVRKRDPRIATKKQQELRP